MSSLRFYREYGLECMVNAFPFDEDDMRPLFDLAERAAGPALVNIIGGVMPIRPEDAMSGHRTLDA